MFTSVHWWTESYQCGRMFTLFWTFFPILLPKQHDLVNLIIYYFHIKYYHISSRALKSTVLKQFWILSACSVIHKWPHRCIKCTRFQPMPLQPTMPDLPSLQVTRSRLFHYAAVDFIGPFTLKSDYWQKSQLLKGFLYLFICFATKAVYLDCNLTL